VRNVERADQVVGPHERPALRRFVEVDDPRLDADTLGHGGAAKDLLPTLLVVRNGDRAGGAVAGGLAGFVLELLEQSGRVGGELGQRVRRLELTDQPGGVPCRATGERALLQHGDVGDAPTGQVVGDAAADDAATDDDDFSTIRNARGHGFLQVRHGWRRVGSISIPGD